MAFPLPPPLTTANLDVAVEDHLVLFLPAALLVGLAVLGDVPVEGVVGLVGTSLALARSLP